MKASFYLLLLISLLFVMACTENPLDGDNEISAGNREVRGSVRLSNDNTPEGVYVWLEGFSIGTKTDANGNFKFILPPRQVQANSEGVTGAFNIYYFLGNFDLEKTEVFTRDGSFVYSTGEINARGELIQSKLLFQNLRISTTVMPTSVHTSQITVTEGKTDFIMRVDVALQAIKDSVVVFFPGLVNSTFGPLLFRNVDTDEVKILGSTIAGLVGSDLDTITVEEEVRTMVVPLFPDALSEGIYEVIPYLLVKKEDIPDELIRSLGPEVLELGVSYLNIPFKRKGSRRFFRVEE